MGAVVYFGLIGFALVAASPAPVDYLNPKKSMKDVSFDGAPADVTLYDRFSWPIATQNVDASLVKVALLSMPDVTVGSSPQAPQQAAARPSPDGFLPTSFSAPVVPVSFRRIPSVPEIGMHPTLNAPTSLGQNAPADQRVNLPEPTSARPDLDSYLPDPFGAPPVQLLFGNNPLSARSAENQGHQVQTRPSTLRESGPPDTWAGRPDAPWPGVTTGDRVYLRKAPTLSGQPLDLVPIGTNVIVTQSRGDWVRIELDEKTGWMFAEFVAAP